MNGAEITILVHSEPPVHVKNPLSRNIRTRLRMYKHCYPKLGLPRGRAFSYRKDNPRANHNLLVLVAHVAENANIILVPHLFHHPLLGKLLNKFTESKRCGITMSF